MMNPTCRSRSDPGRRDRPSCSQVRPAFRSLQEVREAAERDFILRKLDETAPHGMHVCDYLLACDMEMDPTPGYAFTSWETGYGDLHAGDRRSTLGRAVRDRGVRRRVPGLIGTPGSGLDGELDTGVGR